MLLALFFTGALLGLFVWWECWGGKWRRYRLPPGPPSVPVLGSLPFMKERPIHSIREWKSRFGGIFTIWIGPSPTIVVADIELMKEAFIKAGYLFNENRAPDFFNRAVVTPPEGIGMSAGDDWRLRRRLCLYHLRELGLGRQHMENRILAVAADTVKILREEIAASGGAPLKPMPVILHFATNVIINVISGQKWSMEDPRHMKYHENLKKLLLKLTSPVGLLITALPWVTKVPGLRDLVGWCEALEWRAELEGIGKSLVAEAKSAWEQNKEDQSCLLYRLFKEENLSERNILCLTLDLIGAGTDAISVTINFAILYLLQWPEWEERCQAELEKEVGRTDPIGLAHRQRLPIITALLHETQRFTNMLDMVPFHTASKDGAQLSGYDVPKNVTIDMNIATVMSDPQNFPEPEKFKPERFLQEAKGGGLEVVELPDALCPFGVGRRNCIGESVARDQMFLFLTSLLQAFRLRRADPENPPSIEGIPGYTLFPHPYSLKLLPAH